MSESDVKIEGMGKRGEGVARLGERAVFVPYTLPDEEVRADGEGDRLSLVAVEKASPDRIAPFCRYYGRCGGCQLQHWREEPYRAWKASLVSEALKSRADAQATQDFEVDAPIGESDSTPGREPEVGHLRSVVGLVWRSVVVWLLLLALLTLARLLG